MVSIVLFWTSKPGDSKYFYFKSRTFQYWRRMVSTLQPSPLATSSPGNELLRPDSSGPTGPGGRSQTRHAPMGKLTDFRSPSHMLYSHVNRYHHIQERLRGGRFDFESSTSGLIEKWGWTAPFVEIILLTLPYASVDCGTPWMLLSPGSAYSVLNWVCCMVHLPTPNTPSYPLNLITRSSSSSPMHKEPIWVSSLAQKS